MASMRLPKRLPVFYTHTLSHIVQQTEHWIRTRKTLASVIAPSLSRCCVALASQLIFVRLVFLAYKVGITKADLPILQSCCGNAF